MDGSNKNGLSAPASNSTPFGAEGRRSFLGRLGLGVAGAAALGGAFGFESEAEAEIGPVLGMRRKQLARRIRKGAAKLAAGRPHASHSDNGEEIDYPRVANYSKGLPHDAFGEADPVAYAALLGALSSGRPADFEAIPLGGDRKLTNPQSGLAFDLEGPDSHSLGIRPAPRIDSPENSGEMIELYWMALTRDVHYSDYGTDPTTLAAAAELSALSDFRGPKEGGAVTPNTLFRGAVPGATAGPHVSQFLLVDAPFGTLTINQRQKTAAAGLDYMTGYAEWLAIQRGISPVATDVFDPVPRYIRNARDLATYVHFDALYEAYFNATLILLALGAPIDAGNPYGGYTKTMPFGTFGGPHILSLVTEVATRALKAVWFQKWYVHRRLRPEAFGGRVHNHVTGARSYPMIDAEVLNSDALARVFSAHGSYLLPMAFPEGSPTHPAYGAGHATVAAACTTILKAWFDEDFVLSDPVVASADGTSLVPYTGPDAGSLTVGGELNKVAANVAIGRNAAGVHWRTDQSESFLLGEAVAMGILEEQKLTMAEPHSFTLTKFDGTTVTI